MGIRVAVPEEGIFNLISQAYHAGGEYQWARESLVNAVQAHATWVEFGVDRQGVEKTGIPRRYVADNGVGMNEDDLKLFLSSFGGGGRKISKTENFGQGFKASCYEWNSYGVVVMSWTPETPEGRMIWIHLDRSVMKWELKDFTVVDDDGEKDYLDCITPAPIDELHLDMRKFKLPEIEKKGSGTVFLFLGDDIDRDTSNGDYMRGETTRRGIAKYLNNRFLEVPSSVSVNVVSLEAKANNPDRRESKDISVTSVSGKQFTLHSRKVRGAKNFIPMDGTLTGTVKVKHGTDIDWYLTKDIGAIGDGGYGPARPFVAVQYEDESYDRKDQPRNFRSFGITDTLRERVWLIVKPPKYDEREPTKWGVMPQASRGMLIGKGDADLPWEDWQDNFYAQMPKPIRDAILASQVEASPSSGSDRRERLKRTAERLATRFRPIALVMNPDGRIPGVRSESPTGESRSGVRAKTGPSGPRSGAGAKTRNPDSGGAGDKATVHSDDLGDVMASERRKSDGIPAVCWDPKFDGDEVAHAARWDEKDTRDGSFGTIHFNSSFPMFESEFRFWMERYPKAGQEDLMNTVKQVYEDELVAKVMHAFKLKGQILETSEDGDPVRVVKRNIDKWIHPEALTTGVMGLVNVEQRVSVLAGARFGPGAKSRIKKK